MSVGEKIVNTGGGAVKSGIGWGLTGAMLGVLAGGLLCGGLPLLLLATTTAVFSTGGLLIGTLAAASCVALGVAGAYAAGAWMGMWGAALGVVKGGLSGFFKRSAKTPALEQEMAMEQQRNMDLRAQIAARQAERQNTAAGFENPNATSNNAANVQTRQQDALSRPAAPTV